MGGRLGESSAPAKKSARVKASPAKKKRGVT
jgi:hypothetical protein